jgi:hypothetical protein
MGAKTKYPVINNIKQCTKCKEFKSINEYYFDNSTSKPKPTCKICDRKRRQLPEVKYRDSIVRNATRIKRVYNIDTDYYNSLLIAQNYKCAICKKKEINAKGRLSIDHCHDTGKIRGLLCRSCNLGIGNLKDNISLLAEAIKYLEKYKEK